MNSTIQNAFQTNNDLSLFLCKTQDESNRVANKPNSAKGVEPNI